ncbi:MAG: RNA polymerase factor sigma-54 [Rhodospirillales bacterium]|nr:RNA polymerase factor sigma-54 [Rhodospirillales bacterium]
MVMSPRLEQRLGQSLVMTPQLQQAIKLLQLSNLELSEFVEGELETNPLLERDEQGPADTPERDNDYEDGFEEPSGLDDLSLGEPAQSEMTTVGDLDADLGGAYEDGSVTVGQFAAMPEGGGYDPDMPGLEETLAESTTLRAYLDQQLGMAHLPAEDALIAAYLIDQVEDSGYLGSPIEEAAEILGAEIEDIERVLAILQGFEPTGVFARDLAECMALQLKERDRFDPAMQTFVENLDLVAGREFSKLANLCGVDQEDIVDMLAEIRELDPKPGLSFAPDTAEPIIPDVLMVRHPKGGWLVELNAETLPRVLVNNSYHAQVQKLPMSKEDRKYLAEQFQSANWLVRALHQRATTILKVSSEIVRRQDAFFKKGVQHLKPMVLRDVADEIEMHESTVSRVTSNKYMVTPRGIFELKYFFSSSIGATDGGEAHSAEAVRHRIKELIDAEDPKKILSDDKLVKLLVDDGYDIARRTVAKYREAMRIGSSVERRRQKAPPK